MKDDIITLEQMLVDEREKDKICPECFNEMKTVNAVKGGYYKRRVDKYVCECGYHTIKRTDFEILRDLGYEE